MSHRPDGPDDAAEMKLAELAERSGFPARTIRLYITRGIIPRPLRRGKKAAYSEVHLTALARVAELQRAGRTLAEIGALLAAERGETPSEPEFDTKPEPRAMLKAGGSAPAPAAWLEFELDDDVRVQVRADVSAERLQRLRAALARLAKE